LSRVVNRKVGKLVFRTYSQLLNLLYVVWTRYRQRQRRSLTITGTSAQCWHLNATCSLGGGSMRMHTRIVLPLPPFSRDTQHRWQPPKMFWRLVGSSTSAINSAAYGESCI